jgi:alkylation response protein AidB-like acyl-CoA dehydrogenase
MATQIEAARLLTLQAAALKDAGKKVRKNRRWRNFTLRKSPSKFRKNRSRFTAATATRKIIRRKNTGATSKLCTIGEGTLAKFKLQN